MSCIDENDGPNVTQASSDTRTHTHTTQTQNAAICLRDDYNKPISALKHKSLVMPEDVHRKVPGQSIKNLMAPFRNVPT
jgi:hypothetical protein